jgi:cytochrome d ubiquinol oxidase subunit II
MMALQITWFVIIAVLIVGYAILDGFDLGVGFWYLLARGQEQRRTLLNAIGPVWDGNEVWLLTAGGALFAAFPPVYATAFSSMYLALVILLLGLIFRAASLEFRSKVESRTWRSAWDVGFAVGSIVPALLFGVAAGNIVSGMPLDGAGHYTGTFLGLLGPHALLVGLTGLAMFATHGALYIVVKTDGELATRARTWAWWAWIALVALFAVTTVAMLLARPRLLANFEAAPPLFLVPGLVVTGLVGIAAGLRRGRAVLAFLSSATTIAALVATAGISIFPYLVPALGQPELGLTIHDSSASMKSLQIMLVLAGLGMPLVLLYTVYIYRTFRGKVVLDDASY